jgi:acetyl esterase/lipase
MPSTPSVQTLQFGASGGQPLLADLYRPCDPKNLPAIIAVSGGGWLRGDRSMLADWGMYLASKSFAVMSIDYRQSPESYPENVRNVHSACEYLRKNASNLGIDPDRIGLLGISSGAHLASLAALTLPSQNINAIILVYGIFDLASHWEFEKAKSPLNSIPLTERMMGGCPSMKFDAYQKASPCKLVEFERANGMDAMIIWGCDDDIVCPSQSHAFAAALSAAGAAVTTLAVRSAGHFWFSKQSVFDVTSKNAEIAPQLLEFLANNL